MFGRDFMDAGLDRERIDGCAFLAMTEYGRSACLPSTRDAAYSRLFVPARVSGHATGRDAVEGRLEEKLATSPSPAARGGRVGYLPSNVMRRFLGKHLKSR